MKKIIVIATTSILVFLLLISSFFFINNDKKDSYTDEELKDYYDDYYNNNNDDHLANLTDEELKKYYENLYGTGDNDLTEHEDSIQAANTIYMLDDETQEYTEYLRLNYRKAYMIQDTSSKVTYGSDHQGDLVSLLTSEGETSFKYGIAVAGASACWTYTDVKAQGYEKFSGYFGAHYLARFTNSSSTSFRIRFLCDGEYTKDVTINSKDTIAEYVEIDLSGVEVFQIYVDIMGNGSGDYVGMGDPKFTKQTAKPYLCVDDLEFNLPEQVTKENILQYAEAKNISSEDISDEITYETNYVTGKTGTFNVTYIIKDIVNDIEVERRDTVKMTVYDIDYSEEWTLEDFKTPYVNYLYHPRQTYSPQMRKLFDLLIELALDFDDSQWQKKYRSNIYTSQNARNVSLSGAGIYLKYSEVNTVLRGIWDCEPRAFMLLNLDLMGSYYSSTNSVTGLTNSCWFWAQNLTTEQYNERVQLILDNSVGILSVAKDDMTYAQKWKYVADNYSSKISYSDGATLYNSIGLFKGKCNGNSQGLVYLAQRLSIQSIYSEGMSTAGFHAWSYQKLPDNSTWYMSDRLWGSVLAKDGNHGHNVYKNRGYDFPEISPTSYSSYNYTYPSIWGNFKQSSFLITEGESIDIEGNLLGIDGIFLDILSNYTLSIKVTDSNGNKVSSDISTLKKGIYNIVYTINYTSSLYNITRDDTVTVAIYEPSFDYEDIATNLTTGSLYAGGAVNENINYDRSNEVTGLGYRINDGASVSISLEGIEANILTFKYGSYVSARTNSYTMSNCRISLSVYADGVLIHTGNQLTAWSKYEDVLIIIPEGTKQLTFTTNKHSSGGCHGALIDLSFGSTK